MIIQFSAQIDSAKANNDMTLTFKVETQELSPTETSQIFSLFQKQIWIALCETEITHQDLNIPEKVDPLDEKSPSQRLRDRLFVFWKERKVSNDFDSWYKSQLEKIGQSYLDKLN
jgi:hypothetical protein